MRLTLVAIVSSIALVSGCASDDRRFDLGYDFERLDGARLAYTFDFGIEMKSTIDVDGHDFNLTLPVGLSMVARSEIASADSGRLGVVTAHLHVVDVPIHKVSAGLDGKTASIDVDKLRRAPGSDASPAELADMLSGLSLLDLKAEPAIRDLDREIDEWRSLETSSRTVMERKGKILSEEDTTPPTVKAKIDALGKKHEKKGAEPAPEPEKKRDQTKGWSPNFPAQPVRMGEEWEVRVPDLVGKGTLVHLTWHLDRVETPPGTSRPQGVLLAEVEVEGPKIKKSSGNVEARLDLETGIILAESVRCDTTEKDSDSVTKTHFHIDIVTTNYTPGAAGKR